MLTFFCGDIVSLVKSSWHLELSVTLSSNCPPHRKSIRSNKQFASGVAGKHASVVLSFVKFAENKTDSGTSHSFVDPNGTEIIFTPAGL